MFCSLFMTIIFTYSHKRQNYIRINTKGSILNERMKEGHVMYDRGRGCQYCENPAKALNKYPSPDGNVIKIELLIGWTNRRH